MKYGYVRPLNLVMGIALAISSGACQKESSDADISPPTPAPLPACPIDDGTWDALTKIMNADRRDLDAPGRSIAVFDGEEIFHCAGMGRRQPGSNEDMAAETLYPIASVTKTLTAIGALQEVERGNLSLHDPITTFLPLDWEFWRSPERSAQITLDHLLSQRAAIFDYLEIDGPDGKKALKNYVEGDLVDDWWVMNDPGVMFNYSNDNYVVAGRLLEIADGRYYSERMTEDVLEPLLMERTFFNSEQVWEDDDWAGAESYDWTGGPDSVPVDPDSYGNSWGRPAAYTWSNVEDLARLGQFLLRGDEGILSDDLREQMGEPHADLLLPAPGVMAYGYGLFSDEGLQVDGGLLPEPVLYHTGDMPGYSSDLYLFPGRDLGIAVLTNQDFSHASNEAIADIIAELVEVPAVESRPDWDPAGQDLDAFVGTYADPINAGDLIVTVDGNRLKMDLPSVSSVRYNSTLTLHSPDTFVMTFDGMRLFLTFIKDDEGEYRYARSRWFVWEREANDAPAAVATPRVALPPNARFETQGVLRTALKAR